MVSWMMENLSTILIAIGLILLVYAIIAKMVKDKKQAKSSCGCDCGSCGGACHYKK